MKITLLGTGLMGAPMARRLASAGHELTVWNRNQQRAEALADIATVASTPVAAANGAEIVIAMLIDGPVTKDILLKSGVIETTSPGALVIDMGSVDPDCDREIAAHVRAAGRGFLDAPVSGGVTGAEKGTLAILVGGNTEDFETAQPVFAALGRATLLGPVGTGQVAKLANQLIVATTIGAVAEAFRLAQAAGCDLVNLRDALRGGFADSRILELHGLRMVEGNFTPGGRSVAQLKDLRNVLSVAEQLSQDLPLARCATEGFADLVDNYDGGELDHAAYFLWLQMRQEQ
ncbi:NAD(P)-dependent oxidoreductase [Pelagibacterium halotolerans]|uniref:NAD(P)-dependent oxidoreductase n=1 Tax=Pelagibacterium halotolerans TaxID=531813 RepID=UPI00384A79C9